VAVLPLGAVPGCNVAREIARLFINCNLWGCKGFDEMPYFRSALARKLRFLFFDKVMFLVLWGWLYCRSALCPAAMLRGK
jgi:hypothetical protein